MNGNWKAGVLLMMGWSVATVSAQPSLTEVLTVKKVAQIAQTSPYFEGQAQARLERARGALEVARRWWTPGMALGAQSFHREGGAMNVVGDIFDQVSASNSALGCEFYWAADPAVNWSDKQLRAAELEAVEWEVVADRDAFVLACVEALIEVTATQKERHIYEQAVTDLKRYESDLNVLVESGLRPSSDMLYASAERRRMEAQIEQFEAALAEFIGALQEVLGLSGTVAFSADWPEVSDVLLPQASAYVLPERLALMARGEAAEVAERVIFRDVWMPEFRFSPTISGFGGEFSNLSATSQWLGSVAWVFPISSLFGGGEKRIRKATLSENESNQYLWDLGHDLRLSSLISQMKSYEAAEIHQQRAVDDATRALEQAMERESQGMANPLERMQLQRMWHQTQSEVIRIQQRRLLAEFEFALESGSRWMVP